MKKFETVMARIFTTYILSGALAVLAVAVPSSAHAIEIKTPQVTVPHVNVPQVKTPQANTHINAPQLNTHGKAQTAVTGGSGGTGQTHDTASPVYNTGLETNETIGTATLSFSRPKVNVPAPRLNVGTVRKEPPQ